MATQPVSGVVLISEGFYRLLLRLYPRGFRDELGLHMSRTFRDSSREHYQRDGFLGLVAVWMFTVMDVVKTALEERAQTGEWFMSKETIIRIGGPAMIAAGALWMIGSIDRFDSMTWMLLFPAVIGMAVGLLALNAYARGSTSPTTRITAVVAVATASLAILGGIGLIIAFRGDLRPAVIGLPTLLISVLFMSLLVLGVQLLREPLLLRWGGFPLLLNLPVAVYMLLGAVSLLSRNVWLDSPPLLEIGVLMLAGLAMVLLGVAMLPPKPQSAIVT